jgi:hypothetical protein
MAIRYSYFEYAPFTSKPAFLLLVSPQASKATRIAKTEICSVRCHERLMNTVESAVPLAGTWPYLPVPGRLGMVRSPLTTGGKSFTSSYTSLMNRSLLCFVSPCVVAS